MNLCYRRSTIPRHTRGRAGFRSHLVAPPRFPPPQGDSLSMIGPRAQTVEHGRLTRLYWAYLQKNEAWECDEGAYRPAFG